MSPENFEGSLLELVNVSQIPSRNLVSPTDTGVFASGIFVDGKYTPVVANPGMKQMEFTADSKHIIWAQGVPSRNALRIFVDGNAVAEGKIQCAFLTQ
jgi:hypothetical protein